MVVLQNRAVSCFWNEKYLVSSGKSPLPSLPELVLSCHCVFLGLFNLQSVFSFTFLLASFLHCETSRGFVSGTIVEWFRLNLRSDLKVPATSAASSSFENNILEMLFFCRTSVEFSRRPCLI